MLDRNKKNPKLTILLIVAILGFLVLGQLKIISGDVAVSASGLCILSLVMLVIKDIVISNKNNDENKNSDPEEKKKTP